MLSFRQFFEAVVSTKRVRDPATKGTTKRLGDAGFHAETGLANQLKKHSLMDADAKTGGSTGGHDFHVVHKKVGPVGGSEAKTIGGECPHEPTLGYFNAEPESFSLGIGSTSRPTRSGGSVKIRPDRGGG